jgi:hypothetical protein
MTSPKESIMNTFNRVIRTAMEALARKRQRDYLTDIICGPDTTYRSELMEVMSSAR